MVGLLWLIIGITIGYFVMHEKNRQKFNLENRLLNVNNTVIDAYERGVNLQKAATELSLPISPVMSDSDVSEVIEAVNSFR